MEDLYIMMKDLWDYKYIQEYFYKKDSVSIKEIIDAFEFELERNKPVEEEPNEIDERFAYEYDMWEGRKVEEYANDR